MFWLVSRWDYRSGYVKDRFTLMCFSTSERTQSTGQGSGHVTTIPGSMAGVLGGDGLAHQRKLMTCDELLGFFRGVRMYFSFVCNFVANLHCI